MQDHVTSWLLPNHLQILEVTKSLDHVLWDYQFASTILELDPGVFFWSLTHSPHHKRALYSKGFMQEDLELPLPRKSKTPTMGSLKLSSQYYG